MENYNQQQHYKSNTINQNINMANQGTVVNQKMVLTGP
jgi:hypothetical protein